MAKNKDQQKDTIPRTKVEDWFMGEVGWARWPYPGPLLVFYDPNNLDRPPIWAHLNDDDTVDRHEFEFLKGYFKGYSE